MNGAMLMTTDKNIQIKRATDSEIPAIESILLDVVEWFDRINEPQWEKEHVTWKGLSEYFVIEDFLVAYIENEPVGCMALIDHDPEFWNDVEKGQSLFIHKLAVKRDYAGHGIAKTLINYALEFGKEHGIPALRLDCHKNKTKLRSMYENLGFVFVGEKQVFEDYHAAFYIKDII